MIIERENCKCRFRSENEIIPSFYASLYLNVIVTLTLNPSIDVTLTTDRILYDDRSYILSEQRHAGGKGINAAQVINSYGGNVHAIATCGGNRGESFQRMLDNAGIERTLIPVEGETRRNFAVNDQHGLTIKVDQAGEYLHPEEIHNIEQAVIAKLPSADWLLLTGSQPSGVPVDFFSRMIHMAAQHAVPTLLDSSGEPLRRGLAACPNVAKPNRPEAERLLNRTLLSQMQSAAAASEIHAMGATQVLLSLASQGVIAVRKEDLIAAVPPSIETGCSIGAGDVLAATYIWALTQGESHIEALRWAVAASTAAAGKPGLSFAPIDEVESIRDRVELRSL